MCATIAIVAVGLLNVGAGATSQRPQETAAPALEVVLARAADYVGAYQRDLSNVVAQEDYLQTADGNQRRLRSDLLVFSTPGSREPWVAFRDVLEVDGLPVEGRQERLLDLFTQSPHVSPALRRRLVTESARYNIGAIQRDLNVPTMALLLLSRHDQPRLSFERRGGSTVEGVAVWEVGFQEVEPPALIRNAAGTDLFARGRVWIEPGTGRVLRTELSARDDAVNLELDFGVRYLDDERLGMLVPARMTERYVVNLPQLTSSRYARTRLTVDCLATYSNFRRFGVQVDTSVGAEPR